MAVDVATLVVADPQTGRTAVLIFDEPGVMVRWFDTEAEARAELEMVFDTAPPFVRRVSGDGFLAR